MIIFWHLVLAHFIADFTLQTNKVAAWKRASRWGMFLHIMTHPVVMIVLTWPYLAMPWVRLPWLALNGWTCVTLVTFLHWIEDVWRIWSIKEVGSPDNTGLFLWDQVVHLTVILAVSPVWAEPRTEPWVIPALCLVLLAHFISVLVYFVENDLWGSSKVLDEAKYVYIGERLIGASLFMLPGAWFLLSFLWVAWLARLYYAGDKSRTWIHLLVGNAAVVLLGLIARGCLS